MNGRTNTSGITVNNGISIPLEAPTNLLLSAGDQTVSMTWTDPIDKYTETFNELVSQWSYDTVVRKEGSAPSSPQDGTVVAKITSKNQHQNIPYTDTGMENDKRWYYSIFAHNQFHTPSDAISDSDIPTANVVTEYQQSVQLNMAGSPADGLKNTVYGITTNGTHIVAYLEYSPRGVSGISSYQYKMTYIDSSFVRSESIDLNANDSPYDLFGDLGSAIHLGNYAFFAFTSNNVGDDNFYVDQNLVIHTIDQDFRNNGNNGGPDTYATSVDNQIAIMHYQAYNGSNTAYKIDTNLVYTRLGGSGLKFGNTLDGAKYGVITNNRNSANCYDSNGIRSDITLSGFTNGTIFTSACDTHMIFTENHPGVTRAVNEDLVVSNMDNLPFDTIQDSTYIGSTILTSNMQTLGMGMFCIACATSADPGYLDDPKYTLDLTIDKNLLYHTDSKLFPVPDKYVGVPSWTTPFTPLSSVRMGRYVAVVISHYVGYFDIGEGFNDICYIMKNGYESDLEEV